MLFELVHARMSLEAWADEVSQMQGGLRGELATRDSTYYWKWVD